MFPGIFSSSDNLCTCSALCALCCGSIDFTNIFQGLFHNFTGRYTIFQPKLLINRRPQLLPYKVKIIVTEVRIVSTAIASASVGDVPV